MQQKKWFVPVTIILLLLILVIGAFSKDRRKQDIPSIPTPPVVVTPQPVSGCGLTVLNPLPYTKISLPITLEAVVANNPASSCRWTVFEAQAGTVLVKNALGESVGSGILQTTSEWMTNDPVTYTAPITFTAPISSGENLFFIIVEDDPSGGEAGVPDEIHISVETI